MMIMRDACAVPTNGLDVVLTGEVLSLPCELAVLSRRDLHVGSFRMRGNIFRILSM